MIRTHGYKKIQYEEGDNIDGMFNALDLIDCNVDVAKRRLFLLKQSLNDYWFNTDYTGNTDFDVEASMFGRWYWKKVDTMLSELESLIDDMNKQREMIYDTFGEINVRESEN